MKAEMNVIETREELEATVGRISAKTSARDGLLADLESEINEARSRYEPQITAYGEEINSDFEATQRWAEANPSTFSTRKSLDLMHGTIGFRTGQPRLKLLSGWTWNRVLELMAVNRLTDYIRQKQEPDKERILAERDQLTDELMKRIGVKVVQDETFYIEPKREEAGISVGKVAGFLLLLALPFLGGCYTPSEEEKASFWLKQIAVEEKQQTAYLEQIAVSVKDVPYHLKRISEKVQPRTIDEIVEEANRLVRESKEKNQ
jgi:phage host-nuclease inhibitor protein Gam